MNTRGLSNNKKRRERMQKCNLGRKK